jgi:hypothetical protein
MDALSALFEKKCRRADIFDEAFERFAICDSNDLSLAWKYFQFELRELEKFSHAKSIDSSKSCRKLSGR